MNLSVRFEEALRYALIIHAGQMRKGTEVPCLLTVRRIPPLSNPWHRHRSKITSASRGTRHRLFGCGFWKTGAIR